MPDADRHARIAVRLQPRASKDEIVGMRGDTLAVRVTAPPVGGRANQALRKLIARRAGIAPSRVSIVRGALAREKLVAVAGMDETALRAALGVDDPE